MKHLIFSLVCLCASISFSQAQVEYLPTTAQPSPQAESLTQLGQQFFERLVTAKLEGAAILMAEDFQLIGLGEKPLDKAAYVGIWKRYHEQAHDLGIKELVLVPMKMTQNGQEQDVILAWGEARWTPHQMEKPIVSWMHMVMIVKDGKLSLIYNFEDQLPQMLQMGFTLTPPTGYQGDN